MITQTTISQAVELLVQASNPVRIYLFGSYARGDFTDRSDLDFLVLLKEVKNRHREIVHLHDVLQPLRIPVDILLASESTFHDWEDVIGTIFYVVKKEGQVCYDAG